MDIFFCSDLHLGHEKLIINSRNFKSVEEHDELIITNWNMTVTKKSKIFLLGDITMETHNNYHLLKRLKGYIHVIPGNHETHQCIRALNAHVGKITGLTKYKEFWLSHCPIHPDELRGKINIHGHVHYNSLTDKRYFNVSMENINYTPISIDEIRSKINQNSIKCIIS